MDVATTGLGDGGRLRDIRALAMALLTLLGAAGERLVMDRQLKSNTSKTRSHSLFRQGCMFHELIPNMPEHRLVPLIQQFADLTTNFSANLGTEIPNTTNLN